MAPIYQAANAADYQPVYRELEPVLLEDALQIVRLYGETGDPKYPVAVRKWMARWLAEEKPSLEDIAGTACSFVERG